MVEVELGGMNLVAAYQPIWRMDEQSMKRYKRNLKSLLAITRHARLVIEGDFYARLRVNAERPGVCGKYGWGRMNDAGRDFIE